MASEAPKLARDGTMEVTAKEGIAFLEKESPDLAENIKKMKEDEAQKPANGAGDVPAAKNGTPKIPRDNTMVQTAEEGKKFVEKEGGVNQDAKTRGQEKEIEAKEEKEATKRAADDKTNDTDEAKKQKVEEKNGNNGAEKEEKPAEEEAKE